MTIKRRRKSTRSHGSRTCGYGVSHRGAGERGGRGRAGTGKKGKCKMPVKGKWTIQYFGKTGFKSKGLRYAKHYTINLRQLEELLDNFVKEKFAVLEKDVYVVNLTDLGIDKLLSAGKVSKKFKINVAFASKAAVEKVKAAGGEVVLLEKKAKKMPETEEKGKEE
ncbi:uL15 family ribosomal protein [Candidatus Woesearchaeota archaeon]|nr:uL15 family ribosomal protein [Candidatus Woesearchaeota archaeon]MBW3006052.1 uL15 family ribosomal protein [Candidatus Woesearchaeota archaeon]